MSKQRNSLLVLAVITGFVVTALLLPGLISAGDLEPSGPPGPTMRTLDEIYDKLNSIESIVVPAPCEAAPVEKTGQTTSYATGDDGNLQKGVAWPSPRFTDNGDGTVTDNLTGMIWLKNANCDGTKTWTGALNYCNNLANGACGLTDGSVADDWRLPNIKELLSLIDYGQFDPSLPSGHPFSGVQSDSYWSSTTYGSTSAWLVDLIDGYTDFNDRDSENHVWPVRGGN